MSTRRRVPIDLIALAAIALVVFVTHLRYVRRGMCFDDPSWLFHFGTRTADGAVPYVDYVYPGGPLPIYVEALFQRVFGASYVASLYASLVLLVARVQVVWMLGRRLVGLRAAAAVAAFCALDTSFAFASHRATAYVQLFIAASALFVVLSTRASGRRAAAAFLVASGVGASLVITAHPAAGLVLAFLLAVATVALWWRGEWNVRQLGTWWAGHVVGLVVVVACFPVLDALSFAAGPHPVLNAVLGGALGVPGHRWWGGLLVFLVLPLLVVAVLAWLATRDGTTTSRTLGLVAVIVGIVVTLAARHVQLDALSDLPRLLVTVIAITAIAAPRRVRTWLGLDPLLVFALGMIPLATDWALAMVVPGRGGGDATSLMVAVVLLALASTQLSSRVKTALGVALALVAVFHVVMRLYVADAHPFARDGEADGRLRASKHSVAEPPALRGLRLPRARLAAVYWLGAVVKPHHTCFIDGNVPVLYTLLSCTNPTRLDSTAPHFASRGHIAAAIRTVRAHPPDIILVQTRAARPELDALLAERYATVGLVADAVGPVFAADLAALPDALGGIRVYQRR